MIGKRTRGAVIGIRAALTVVPLAAVLWLAMGGLAWAMPDKQGTVVQGDELALVYKTALAWLVPIGLGMLACGAVPPDRAAAVVRVGWLALGVSVIGYWLAGFAFQFGGAGFAYEHPDLVGLAREWTWAPLDAAWGPQDWGTQWGLIGLEGYLLRGLASTPTALRLFFAQLPWITTAVAVPLWSLQGRTRPVTLLLSSVLLALIYSLIGNWAWGGGWLANLGLNLDLGHGYVDLAGAGVVHLAGAASALAGMLAFGVRGYARSRWLQLPLPTLAEPDVPVAAAGQTSIRWTARDEPYVPMPGLHLPVLATFGAWLAAVGWLGWTLISPIYVVTELQLPWIEMLIGLLLAAAGGAMVAMVFSWLTTGEANALMAARGVLGAIIAVGAGLPFYPLWTTLAIGAGAGLLVPFVQYAIDHLLRLDDSTSAIAMHGVPALWGLLAVGLFASGQAGSGWNRVGAVAYLDVDGQGVTGYLALPGYVSDWPGQFTAQVIGATAIGVTAFVLSWLLFALVQGVTRAWQGEYTVRLPRRAYGRRQAREAGTAAAGRRWPRIRFVHSEQEAPAPQSEADTPELDRGAEAPDEALPSMPQRMIAVLALSWHWVRDRAMAVVSSGHRPQRGEQNEVSGERDQGPAETSDVPAETADVSVETADVPVETADVSAETAGIPAETVDVSAETTDVSAETAGVSSEAADASPETRDAPQETGDTSSEPSDDSWKAQDTPMEGSEG